MKNFKKNSIIILIVTLLVLVFVLKDDFPSIMQNLKNASPLFMIIAILIYFIAIGIEARAYQEIIQCYEYSYTFKKAYRMLLITKFFNGITPFSSGGQPMQIYLLKKDGIRLTKATNIIIQNFIIYQAALVILGLFAVLYNHFNPIFEEVILLKYLVMLGFAMNTLVMVGLVVISFSNRFNHFILDKTILLLDKLHLLKNKEKTLNKWSERVDDFHQGAEYLKNNKLLCFRTFMYNLVYLVLTYLMPYFVILALNHGQLDSVSPIKTIVSSAYVLIMGSFVPIPGASGGIEYGYLQFFGNFIKGSLLKASLLIWRTITYYLSMIVGGISFNIHVKKEDKTCE